MLSEVNELSDWTVGQTNNFLSAIEEKYIGMYYLNLKHKLEYHHVNRILNKKLTMKWTDSSLCSFQGKNCIKEITYMKVNIFVHITIYTHAQELL